MGIIANTVKESSGVDIINANINSATTFDLIS